VSIFRNTRTDKGSTRRVRLRHLLPLALLAVVPILLAPAGSAKPPAAGGTFEICVQDSTLQPACGTSADSNFVGNTAGQHVQVTIFNDSSSAGSIGSANINLPAQLRVDANTAAQPSKNVTATATQIQVRGVNIQPGKSFVATFAVDSACSGSGSWTPTAKSGSDFNGTIFTASTTPSAGATSDLSLGCHLSFVTQPAATAIGSPIKSVAGSPPAAPPVEIGLVDDTNGGLQMTSCPAGYTGCSVTITPSSDASFEGGTWANIPFASGGDGFVASFDGSLNIPLAELPKSLTLTAAGDNGLATATAPSDAFDMALYAQGCVGNGCSFSKKQLPGGNTTSFASLVGGTTFNFMTLSPYSLTGALPTGCQDRPDLKVTGFAETDGRNASGTMTITYYVNMDNIKAKYGANVGQQFIAMCVGAKRIVGNVAEDCTQTDAVGGSANGWLGDELTGGQFDGNSTKAVCDPDGFYWGIISSYQDKLDATQNPVVTSWSGQNIAGQNYRAFVMSVPSGWDYRGGP
jgi:hypothetical protein